jgi:hypothetical protein
LVPLNQVVATIGFLLMKAIGSVSCSIFLHCTDELPACETNLTGDLGEIYFSEILAEWNLTLSRCISNRRLMQVFRRAGARGPVAHHKYESYDVKIFHNWIEVAGIYWDRLVSRAPDDNAGWLEQSASL